MDIRERIILKLREVEHLMSKVKKEDMNAKTDSLNWMRWGEFCVYHNAIEEISTQLEVMWYFPWTVDTYEEERCNKR